MELIKESNDLLLQQQHFRNAQLHQEARSRSQMAATHNTTWTTTYNTSADSANQYKNLEEMLARNYGSKTKEIVRSLFD